MKQWQRYMCVQSLIVVSGWFSMRYGWGIEVKCWPVLIAWGALLVTLLPVASEWAKRGRK